MSEDGGTTTRMIVFASVALVLFSIIWVICHFRLKGRDKLEDGSSIPTASTKTASADAPREEESSDEEEEKVPVKSAKATDTSKPPWQPRERQPGEPVYDKFLIGGTVSLGALMWVGATIVLIMSLVDQSKFKDAHLSDFVTLGPKACLVENATSYVTLEKRLDALNTLCLEQWEYSVSVLVQPQQGDQPQQFVSSPISTKSCRSKCNECFASQLFGPNYYAGVEATKRGTYIGNETLVECWAPTKPVQGLSNFFDCGAQRDANHTCYLLQDPNMELEKRMNSTQIGMISAYACYAGGFGLLLVALWFRWRNKTVLEQERQNNLLDDDGSEEDLEQKSPNNHKLDDSKQVEDKNSEEDKEANLSPPACEADAMDQA